MGDGHGVYPGVGVDGHQETHHVGLQVEIDHRALYRRIELGELPAVVYAIEVPDRDQLRIPLTAISGLGARGGLGGEAALHDDDVLQELVTLLEYAVIHPRAVLRVRDPDAFVFEGIVLEFVDVETQYIR